MSVRSVIHNFNMCFLIFGVGSINYISQINFKMSLVLNAWRCIIIYAGLKLFYRANLSVITLYIKFNFNNFVCEYIHFILKSIHSCKLLLKMKLANRGYNFVVVNIIIHNIIIIHYFFYLLINS